MKKLFNIFREIRKDKKGVMGFFIAFVMVAVLLTILFAFGIPLLININTELYKAGENLIGDTLSELENIQNSTIKQELSEALTNAKTSTLHNISVLSWFYQYSWVFIIIIVAMVIFMLARSTVEVQIR